MGCSRGPAWPVGWLTWGLSDQLSIQVPHRGSPGPPSPGPPGAAALSSLPWGREHGEPRVDERPIEGPQKPIHSALAALDSPQRGQLTPQPLGGAGLSWGRPRARQLSGGLMRGPWAGWTAGIHRRGSHLAPSSSHLRPFGAPSPLRISTEPHPARGLVRSRPPQPWLPPASRPLAPSPVPSSLQEGLECGSPPPEPPLLRARSLTPWPGAALCCRLGGAQPALPTFPTPLS